MPKSRKNRRPKTYSFTPH